MKRYKIEQRGSEYDPRWFVVTNKGKTILDADGNGYKSDRKARQALCYQIATYKIWAKNRKFWKILKDKSGKYTEFLDKLESLWNRREENAMNFDEPEEIHRLRDYYDVDLCGLSDDEFLERYVNLKKYHHLNFVSK